MSSQTWIALLRAVNLGAVNKVPMAELRALLEASGYGDVRTVLQSGNAVFTADGGKASDIEQEIESRIEAALGLEVPVLVRSARQLAAVVERNPFLKAKVDPKELHAAFLSEKPSAKKVAGLDADAYAPDQFEVGDRVIYTRLPNGVQGTRLPNWEKVLGVTVTARNWNTVTRLHKLAAG